MHRLFAEGQMKIIQSPSIFSFSLDAVLLAHFARVPRSSKRKILDLCAGHGVVPLLLSPKTNAQITGVEVQGRLVHMAERRSEEHTSELQSRGHLVCRLLLEKKKSKSRYDEKPCLRD